ncbi:MAG TPA: fasciclin domain-containing protein [Acetobacteraceae bacterium]|nr:fasciclin domain-containing protein [Acetobacteraceae bacterium]
MIQRRLALAAGGLMLLSACTTPTAPRVVPEDGTIDLLTLLRSKPEHSRFVNALVGSGLASRLGRQNGAVTLFAPTNEAFNGLPAPVLALLDNPPAQPSAEQQQVLAALVGANAAWGLLRTPDIAARRGNVVTWDRGRLQVTETGPRQARVVREGAQAPIQVTRADVLASDGVIHVTGAPIRI